MINEPVGDPVVGIKKWSTVNQIIPDEFAYRTFRKGSWIITVPARVSHLAFGLSPEVYVNKHVAGGLSSNVKFDGTLTLI